MELPKKFVDRMKTILGDEYTAFAAAMDTPAVRSLRVNTLKCGTEEFERTCGFTYKKLSFSDVGYIFEYDRIGAHPIHHAGAIYVQEPAAMAAVECTDITPGMKILDACASPGGKSTQAAAKLCGEGVILSNEIDGGRCRTLAQNIERMGVKNAIVTNTDSRELGETYREIFDLAIVDAPCSGEGMMRKNPLAVSEWSTDNIMMCASRQREILKNVAGCIKGGGRLLYSTCTFAPEENEMQIAHFLSEHPDFHLIPINESVCKVTREGLTEYGGESFGEDMKLCRRFYPHISLGEGQFMALLERDANNEEKAENEPRKQKSKKCGKDKSKVSKPCADEEIIKAFLADVLTFEGLAEAEKYKLIQNNDGSFSISYDLPMPGGSESFRYAGVTIGSVQKGRVIPHHSFFMAYGEYFKRQIILNLGDERIEKYLHGESIAVDLVNGYAAVLIGSAAVGGAKVTGGEAKNYYPKGLRI